MKRLSCVVAAVLAAMLAAPALAQEEAAPAGAGKDIVLLKSGQQKLNVNVTDEAYDTVKINGEATPAADIESIKHGDTPPKYMQADSNFRQFQLENAIKNFDEAKKAQARPWLKHYCDYYIGRCYQLLAEGASGPEAVKSATQSINQFTALIRDNPKGFWIPSAMFYMGQCYYNLDDFKNALTVYQQVERANMGPMWTLKAQLWEGKIMAKDKTQADAAVAALTKVADAAKEKYADIYNDAEIALAEAYISGQKYKEAEDLLKKLLESSDKDEVRAAVHNTLGDSYWAQNKVKEARLEFLRTNVLYFKAKAEDARALFRAAECFEALKDKERADKLREELKQTYPDSIWARKLPPRG
jgi:TolA-binding protein